MTTAERLARYEDIFGLPDNVVGEIIAGQLYTHPRPAPAHVRVSSVLGNKVGTSFNQGEGAGAAYCWLIDPGARTLEAYANQDGRWLLLGTWGGDDVASIDPFAAIPLSLSGLWVD